MRVMMSQGCHPYPPGSWKCLERGCYHCHYCRGLEVPRLAALNWARDRVGRGLLPSRGFTLLATVEVCPLLGSSGHTHPLIPRPTRDPGLQKLSALPESSLQRLNFGVPQEEAK